MEITKTEKYNYNYETEVQNTEWQIKYASHLLKASKNYLNKLKKFSSEIDQINAQRLRNEYDREVAAIDYNKED